MAPIFALMVLLVVVCKCNDNVKKLCQFVIPIISFATAILIFAA